ncbi:hypothetical protein PT287_07620 [Lactobacillus sp. ESL0679]|uniref:hypothetical protein n=1 Tax=Lactobacillus sp. ESL0679 TaxID=2983209 RepID=UPI0023F93F04|nr:hypothetical protein [Lactobacillus sp. ESL0679]MDF7683368.1 hypothetical protein [Lactobacillus sp. ESL0679]
MENNKKGRLNNKRPFDGITEYKLDQLARETIARLLYTNSFDSIRLAIDLYDTWRRKLER